MSDDLDYDIIEVSILETLNYDNSILECYIINDIEFQSLLI